MTDIQTTFADLGLNADILESLNGMGYVKPSPIRLSVFLTCWRAVMCWVWRRPVVVKQQRSRCRC